MLRLWCYKKVLYLGHHAEHCGFVVLAGCEVFQVHWLLWYVSLGLFGSGILAVGYDAVTGESKDA